MVSFGPRFIMVWQSTQAMPGFIDGDSLLPPVHVVLLVQMGGVAYGSMMPPPSAGAPPSGQAAGGVPALTQDCMTAISAAVARVSGAGGIGLAASCMRAPASAASDFVGSLIEGAVSCA